MCFFPTPFSPFSLVIISSNLFSSAIVALENHAYCSDLLTIPLRIVTSLLSAWILTLFVKDKRVKLQIWDTAGQERFRTITSTYYRGADGIIMVYDITDKSSFEHINDWLSEVNKYSSEDTCKLLLGNKCDMEDNRDVSLTDVQRLSEVIEVPAMDVSAKTGHNIDKAFYSITEKLVSLKMESDHDVVDLRTISLQNTYNGIFYFNLLL
uniref:Rab GTPase, putative n=1 Tax=Theileria annulata TaxID=5874 RepID=A0A3B0MY42_THEAN